MRQPKEVVLVGQVFESLFEIGLHALGAAHTIAPKRGELSADHHRDEPAEKIEFGQHTQRHAQFAEYEPRGEDDGASCQSRKRSVAQGDQHRPQPDPGKLGREKKRVKRIEPEGERKREQGQRQRFGQRRCTGPGAGRREMLDQPPEQRHLGTTDDRLLSGRTQFHLFQRRFEQRPDQFPRHTGK
jgi:hypothetical protein